MVEGVLHVASADAAPSVLLAGGEFSLMRILPSADVSEQKKVQTITVPAGTGDGIRL